MAFAEMQRSAFVSFYESLVKIGIIPKTVLERDPVDPVLELLLVYHLVV